jgi:hypothetical protein
MTICCPPIRGKFKFAQRAALNRVSVSTNLEAAYKTTTRMVQQVPPETPISLQQYAQERYSTHTSPELKMKKALTKQGFSNAMRQDPTLHANRASLRWRPQGDSNPCYNRERVVS